MSKDSSNLVSHRSQAICLGLTLLFFLFMWSVLPGFVPSQDPIWVGVFSFLTAALFAGVFWLASMCFTVVLVDMRRRRDSMPRLNR